MLTGRATHATIVVTFRQRSLYSAYGLRHLSTTPPRLQTQEGAKTTTTPQDAFSDPKVFKDAQARWGWAPSPIPCAPIVFPQGRPEIANLTKKMTEARIAGGYAVKRVTKEDQNNALEAKSRDVLAKFGKGSGNVINFSPNPHLHLPSKDGSEEPIPLWKKHRMALKAKTHGKAWNPKRKVTRQAMDEIRYLRKQFPDEWTTPKLSSHFNIGIESVAKILRTDFQPSPERALEQDLVRTRARKANVSASLERLKAERHALWLKKNEGKLQKAKEMPSRPKLGAPKRSL
ncbi:Required for respiratory growth protein 9 mitochondrial [Podila epigama]|nr:Required for respiratory growth protein 9 mitochondrial [Podila epigama]